MSRTRRTRKLWVAATVLALTLAIKLLFFSDHHAPPWQLPVTRAHALTDDNAAGARGSHAGEAEPDDLHAVLDLLPLTIPRGDDGVEPAPPVQVGPRWIGTGDERASRLLEETRAALQEKQSERAMELARRGLELDPGFPQLLVAGASAALSCGDDNLDEAKLMARLAVVRAPMYPEAHYNLACAQARQGRASEAAASLTEAKRWGDQQKLDVVETARNDADFDRVRETPEMKALLQKH